MSTQVLIMFPYSGYDPNTDIGKRRERLFWKIVDKCHEVNATKGRLPIVILNRDTERRDQAKAFLADSRSGESKDSKEKLVRVRRTWSVDTCQMWLSGWGKVIDSDKVKDYDRIVQLPGDIEIVSESDEREDTFFNKLRTFIATPEPDIVIGDFTSGDIFNAKELVDLYGTFALMANWFPDIAQAIRKLPLNKPRSEFLNIQVKVLKDLLNYRKFAYEQTLNMLIRSWDPEKVPDLKKPEKKGDWKYKIHQEDLGMLKDDSTFRQYTDCLDQIERTERMLKLLWREINKPSQQAQKAEEAQKTQEFIEKYDRLDRLSTSIRENSRIILRNMLGFGSQQDSEVISSSKTKTGSIS